MAAVTVALGCALLTGCNGPAEGEEDAVPVEAPEVGTCRVLEPEDVAASSDESPTVPCDEGHTAQTYLVEELSGALAEADRDGAELARDAYRRCGREFRRFTGADESLALRTILSWAWFRPSEAAWEQGARWYRCDVVGGTEASPALVALPRTAEGVLLGIPADRWMACVDGEAVVGAVPVPCSEPHRWRAATTIVVGKDEAQYPGDRLVEVLSRDYCSDSVGAWLNYPLDYEYAYTVFGETEWEAGNRRSVCWAGSEQ